VKTVWKFAIPIADEFAIRMPDGAEVLHVEAQHGEPCLWALVDPDRERVDYHFALRGTGHPIAGVALPRDHVGTFMLAEGDFVGHLFHRIEAT
jgi:hypothetical protein